MITNKFYKRIQVHDIFWRVDMVVVERPDMKMVFKKLSILPDTT